MDKRCPICNRMFSASSYNARVYCSNKCKGKARSIELKELIKEGKWKVPGSIKKKLTTRHMIVCEFCKKEFPVKKRDKFFSRFCCKSCKAKYFAEQKRLKKLAQEDISEEGKFSERLFEIKCANDYCEKSFFVNKDSQQKYCCEECFRYVKSKEYKERKEKDKEDKEKKKKMKEKAIAISKILSI